MSATKRRNLKKKIIGCLCLAAIAASMTAAPVVPVVSNISVISASAETSQATVDLSQIAFYAATVQPGFIVALENGTYGTYYKITLQNDYNYTFTGTNSADVQIYVPGGVTANINFNDATIINDDGSYALTGNSNPAECLADSCYINKYVVPFKVEGTLTVSGSLSVDTYSYYGECGDDPAHPTGHQWTAPLHTGSGAITGSDFFIVKYVDENGKTIDQNFYLKDNVYTVTTLPKYFSTSNIQKSIGDFPCLSFTGGTVSADKEVIARMTHTAPDSNGRCTNCGKQLAEVAKTYTVTFETNGGSEVTAAQVTDGTTVSKPTAPTKAYADFGGWYTDEACTVPYDFNSAVTGNITLYAKWDKWSPNSISVNTPPARTVYYEEETFNPTGLVITVAYDNGETENVAYSEANASEFTFSPSEKLATADKAVTITYGDKTAQQAITVKFIPSPPSNPSSSSDSSTPTTPVVKEDNGPKIDGKSGWGNISDKINKTPEGGTVKVDMNGTTELPKDIVSDIAGKDIDLVLDMGNGITWTINGKDVTNPKDVDLSVTANTNNIPVSIINNVTGEKYSIQISLAHEGEFGFTATLTIDLGSKNNGYYANLFYYNEDKKDLEFMDYSKISDGKANLVFTHASDWAIVIDKEVLGKAEDASAGTSIVTETDMIGTVGRRGIAGAVMSLTAALAAGTAIVFKRKARK